MVSKECIAMLLAGGPGSRLGVLTKNLAKPAVPFGGKYRIIDFTLSNCINSGIDTVGVLTQYQPLELNAYIGNGQPWDLDRNNGGVSILPPYVKAGGGQWYKGTANAVYQNINFVEGYGARYVLFLSGDHIYKMDYSLMLKRHKEKKADCTIAAIAVPYKDTNRFGILNADPEGRIYEFEEKPENPKSNKASMGVYIFTWEKLKKYLQEDEEDPDSSNDFGKNIIPRMLSAGERMFVYEFSGYWRDVGTIESFFEANMDLLSAGCGLNLYDPAWRIYGKNPVAPPQYIAGEAQVANSMIAEGAGIYGQVESSVVFYGAKVHKGACISRSIIMPNAVVKEGSRINNAIIAENTIIGKGAKIGEGDRPGITVVGGNLTISDGVFISRGEMVGKNL